MPVPTLQSPTNRSPVQRGATIFPHLEGGFPALSAGAISPRRFVSPDSSGNATQATANSTTVMGVYPGLRLVAAGETIHVGLGPQPVDCFDVLVPGQQVKVGDGGKAVAVVAASGTGVSPAVSGTTIKTTSAGIGGSNQPANDTIEVVSSSSADTTQTITLYGTTNGADTVVVETVTLNGTTAVATTKTDWGVLLGAELSASCAGTVTIREGSADQAITTITTGVLSKGVETVTTADQQAFNVIPTIVASGSSTKQLGLVGTSATGATIYDSQALTGTTAVAVNSVFGRVTKVLTIDLESGRTATVAVGAADDVSKIVGRVLIGTSAAGDTAYINVRG